MYTISYWRNLLGIVGVDLSHPESGQSFLTGKPSLQQRELIVTSLDKSIGDASQFQKRNNLSQKKKLKKFLFKDQITLFKAKMLGTILNP